MMDFLVSSLLLFLILLSPPHQHYLKRIKFRVHIRKNYILFPKKKKKKNSILSPKKKKKKKKKFTKNIDSSENVANCLKGRKAHHFFQIIRKFIFILHSKVVNTILHIFRRMYYHKQVLRTFGDPQIFIRFMMFQNKV